MSRQIREHFLAGSAINRYTFINTNLWGAHQVRVGLSGIRLEDGSNHFMHAI